MYAFSSAGHDGAAVRRTVPFAATTGGRAPAALGGGTPTPLHRATPPGVTASAPAATAALPALPDARRANPGAADRRRGVR